MTQPLWTSDVAAEVTGGTVTGAPWAAAGIAIDSRKVSPGDLFLALPGERVDGHAFVASALQAGAAAALVTAHPDGTPDAAPLLRVADVQAALVQLAEAARARTRAHVIAITGSVGKTGSREMLTAALGPFGTVHASVGNLNNHIGAPLSLARLAPGADYAVLELGMNHSGEIAPLSRMLRPHMALITNVEPVHIGHFENEEAIAHAKAEIFAGVAGAGEGEGAGVAVLNRDNRWFTLLREAAQAAGIDRIVSYGEAGADVQLLSRQSGPDGSEVQIRAGGEEISYRLDAIGDHWVSNSLGVLACVHALELPLGPAAAAIQPVIAGRGRGGQLRIPLASGGAIRLIDESYNASPAAMRAAFRVLAKTDPEGSGRRIAILGDMRELGAGGPDLHLALAPDLLAAKVDQVHAVGAMTGALVASLPAALRGLCGDASAKIATAVAASLRPGDVVLIKGSLGTNMAPLVAAIEARATSTPAPTPTQAEGRADAL